MKIRVLQLGRRVIDHDAPQGATIESVLAEAAIDTRGMDVHVNGEAAEPNRVLLHDDVLTVIPRIKGG